MIFQASVCCCSLELIRLTFLIPSGLLTSGHLSRLSRPFVDIFLLSLLCQSCMLVLCTQVSTISFSLDLLMCKENRSMPSCQASLLSRCQYPGVATPHPCHPSFSAFVSQISHRVDQKHPEQADLSDQQVSSSKMVQTTRCHLSWRPVAYLYSDPVVQSSNLHLKFWACKGS